LEIKACAIKNQKSQETRTVTLRISFDLDDSDLKHLRQIMRQSNTNHEDARAVIAAARELVESATKAEPPKFVEERLGRVELMVRMVEDEDWQLPAEDKRRVLTALSYLNQRDDLIPDATPVLGFLDDAIMIELLVRELQHEIRAYEDFCAFRSERRISQTDFTRRDWLIAKREMLQERMRRRRDAMRRRRHRGWRLFG
jgi:uncharacterized membrane protein YkvA (DUF1232 family)